MTDVTQILNAIEQDDPSASDKLLPLVYEELRVLARQRLANEKPGQSLQPTMLVHEAYLRLVDVEHPQKWNGRGHFFGAAAEAMRRILVERVRRQRTLKRGGVIEHSQVDELGEILSTDPLDLIVLDDALTAFERQWPQKAQLVKLRYFAGFNNSEAADMLGISTRTAERIWTFAKAWLLHAMDGFD